jgi:hypothetical protein
MFTCPAREFARCSVNTSTNYPALWLHTESTARAAVDARSTPNAATKSKKLERDSMLNVRAEKRFARSPTAGAEEPVSFPKSRFEFEAHFALRRPYPPRRR